MGYEKEVREKLLALKDTEYAKFQSGVVTNIPKDTIIGIRTPALRSFAKEVAKNEKVDEFLNDLPHKYYDENLVHFFAIAQIKDFDRCVSEVDRFLPFVDNWAVCDQSSPKVFKKNHEKLLPVIRNWYESSHVYTARFAIRMYMNEFLDEDFDKEYLELISKKQGEDYYLKMMIAWYFATALAKQYDATLPILENHKLEKWVHHKSIQKAVESFRVTDEHKAYLKSLRY